MTLPAAARLRGPGVEIALVPITTAGDRDRTSPFGEIGARGVFVKELEEALLAGRIDVAVHSAKDMTSTDAAGLSVGAYLPRDDPRDALECFWTSPLDALVIGPFLLEKSSAPIHRSNDASASTASQSGAM